MSVQFMISTVEVEINSRCNRKCDYCPVSVLPVPAVPRYMSDHVFERLLDELVTIGFLGRVSYHFYNEPLLRHDLEQLVSRFAYMLPRVYQVLYTNGDMLTDRRYKSLLEAGIDHFKITSHSRKRHPDRPHQDVLFPEDLVLTNRGGTITHLPKPSPATLSLPCYAPSEMLIVTVTGDILLCYEDAERKHVMGNIMENSLEEIWFSEEFVRYRELLAQGGRLEASEICRSCTNRDHRIPGTSHNP